jgi:Core-2/I-Branching enzyme
VRRLINAIGSEDNVYVVHYDKRRPRAEHEAIQAFAAGKKNIIIQRPTAVLWGRYSLFRAQFEGLKLAVQSKQKWTHWFNLSGQCYPLMPVGEIERQCAEMGEASFVRHFQPLNSGDWTGKPETRLTGHVLDYHLLEKVLWLPGIGRRLRELFGATGSVPRVPLIRYKLPREFAWYGGDNWVTLSRSAAEYIVSDRRAARIIRRLNHSAFPEESCYQSVLMNSPLAPKVLNEHRRAIKWSALASPGIQTIEDWDHLQQSAKSGCWFARKFSDQGPILDLIDKNLLGCVANSKETRSVELSASSVR